MRVRSVAVFAPGNTTRPKGRRSVAVAISGAIVQAHCSAWISGLDVQDAAQVARVDTDTAVAGDNRVAVFQLIVAMVSPYGYGTACIRHEVTIRPAGA